MSFGSRLKERREQIGMTQIQLAQQLGITKGAVGNYETEVSSPKAEVLFKIFNILRCDANYLFQDEMDSYAGKLSPTPLELENIKKYRLLDHYGKEAVDTILDIEYKRSMDTLTESETDEQIIYLPKPLHPASAGTGDWDDDNSAEQVAVIYNSMTAKADYIITVSGNSMEPLFSDGDLVLVRSQPSVEIGEIGIYIIAGDQYIKEFQGTHLHSVNPEYEDVPWQDGMVCRGKVIGVLDEAWVR